MADEVKKVEQVRLRTVEDLTDATEWLFTQQRGGTIDSKTADALNTTLKGATYLRATLPLKIAELIVRSSIKKVTIPDKYLPQIGELRQKSE